MKYVLTSVASLASLCALPAMAHSGEHLHPHGVETWLPAALAAVTVVGTMTFVRSHIGKGQHR